MSTMLSPVRRTLAAIGMAGAVVGAMAVPTVAAANPEQCPMIAWNQCSFDANGQPIQVTVECYEQAYQDCLDWYGRN